MLKRTSAIKSFLKCSSNLTPQYTAEKYALKRGDYGALTKDDQNHLISLVNGKGIYHQLIHFNHAGKAPINCLLKFG